MSERITIVTYTVRKSKARGYRKLTANEDIVSIDNFNMEVDGSMLTVSFTVNSVYGDINDVKGAI